MAGDNERSRLFTRRAILIGAAQTGVFSLLAGRLYYLQVIQGQNYRTLAEENRINLRLIAPSRGQILDRLGTPMALNEQNYRLILLPEQVDDIDALLDKLTGYIAITDGDRKRIARDLNESGNLNAVLVRDNLTWDQVAEISLHTLDLPGTDIDTGEVRSYPYGEATSHVLGYVGTISQSESSEGDDDDILAIPGFRIGKSGIEKQYDTDLRGEPGNVQLEVNAHGRVVRELSRTDPKSGQDFPLTIDIGLQQFAYRTLSTIEGGAAIVLDVDTGAIQTLVSYPGFDPNLFTYGISQDDWSRLNNDIHSPLLNKVSSGVYAPGSTFKPVVAMAALEADILNPEATVYCPGYLDLGNYRFHCWKHGGHGHVNLHQAVAGSCDVFFYDLGRRVGIDRMQAMAKRFGFGEKLGIDLPHESAGLIPGRTWKASKFGVQWQQGETLVAAIGQGYTLVTPLQLAMMAARLSNGGKAITPHLYMSPEAVAAKPAAMGFDPKHLTIVQQAMSAVVNENIGTAYAARIKEEGMEMAGKTGTSQVKHISETEREEGLAAPDKMQWKDRDHALFAGFAPIEKPRFAIGVIVEHGGSGAHMAAPIARDILRECQMRAANKTDDKTGDKKP
jgi:penicillin-binding protein 2